MAELDRTITEELFTEVLESTPCIIVYSQQGLEYSKNYIKSITQEEKEIFEKIAPTYNITLEEWNHDIDHVHILFRGQPNTEISKFINAYKSASSRLIKKEFPQIRKSLWKEMFWSQSFCLLTTGGATVDIIKQYIQSQGKKDDKQSH